MVVVKEVANDDSRCKISIPIQYTVPVPSAQVKSALLLAGLNVPGDTIITETEKTRDHTERMLSSFGAEIKVEDYPNRRLITLSGYSELKGQNVRVPSDPSSAAFLFVLLLQ